MTDGPVEGAYDPHVLDAVQQLESAEIQVTPDGKRDLATLLYVAEQRDKVAADENFNGFVSHMIGVAHDHGFRELDRVTLQQITAQIDWWPFC